MPLHRNTDTHSVVKIFLSSVFELLYCEAYQCIEECNDELSFQSQVNDFIEILKGIQYLKLFNEVRKKEEEIHNKIIELNNKLDELEENNVYLRESFQILNEKTKKN